MVAHAKSAAPNKGSPNNPNKGRRTDERTPQEVARTNATLQMFTSQRRSSWMNGLGSATVAEGATGNVGAASRGDGFARGRNNTAAQPRSQGTNQDMRPFSPAQGADGRPGSSTRPSALVEHESTLDFHAPAPLTSVAPPSTNVQPGLPSPAPSDRNTDSPVTVPDDDMPPNLSGKRPRGRPPKNPAPSVPNALQMSVGPKRPRGRPRKQPLDNGSSSVTPVQSPLPATIPNTPAASSPLLQSNLAIPVPQSSVQTPQSFTGLYNTLRMHQMMEDFFSRPGLVLNEYDCGRKALLMEAISKHDLFYLVLSQVFCLHSCEPTRLPKQTERVSAQSWAALENLLCSNEALTPSVLKWFSEFPAPIYFIYASSESSALVKELVVIERFLQELPRQWDRLITMSQQRMAPPLTEDMRAELYLMSPVLQTTIFRAIARGFWGASDNKGSQILESLHRIEQEKCNLQHWRRTGAERQTAYDIYARLLVAWRKWCESRNPPDSFVAPMECNYFHQVPQGMSRIMAVDPNAGGSANMVASQQRLLIEASDRMLAQQQQAPDSHAATQQRQSTGGHTRAGSQSLRWSPYEPPNQASRHPHQHTPNATTLQSNAPPIQVPQPYAQIPAPHLYRLLPAHNAPPKPLPVHPDTPRVSLHQAYLRSPTPSMKKLEPDGPPLYRYVAGYVLSPTSLDNSSYAQAMTFPLSQAQLGKIPTTTPATLPGEPGSRLLDKDSTLYRLRCSMVPPDTGFQTENSWVTAENVWPDILLFQINGHYLESRKKLHHVRYLPIDLSLYLQPGENVLKIYILPGSQDRRQYAIAVEMISVTSHDSILSKVPLIPSTDSLSAIKRSLAASPDDDDEVTMTSSSLTIPLFDPYHADRICNIPARGTACLHRDCFDLETFLSQCKREEPGYASSPDSWRCPICKGDVRPQTLIKDGFLMEVRQKLEEQGALNTRAIVVEADGSWKPKAEPQATGVKSPSLEREEGSSDKTETAGDQGSAKGKQKAVEVIELD